MGKKPLDFANPFGATTGSIGLESEDDMREDLERGLHAARNAS